MNQLFGGRIAVAGLAPRLGAFSVRSILFGVSIALPALLAAQSTQAVSTPDTVKLVFAWPAGTALDVNVRRYQEQTSTGRADTNRTQVSYRLSLTPLGDDLQVSYDNLHVPGVAGMPSEMARAMAQATAAMPSYRVTREGDFVALTNWQGMRAAVDTLLGTMGLDTLDEGARELFESLLSEEMLAMKAAEEWNMIVGNWSGTDYEIGSTYEAEAVERMPVLGGVDVPMTYTFGAVRRVPCDSTDSGRSCVELRMESRPDPDALKEVVRRVLGQAAPGMAPDSMTFESENSVVLVSDPRTLLPYSLVAGRTVDMTFTMAGQTETGRQVQVREYRFRHVTR